MGTQVIEVKQLKFEVVGGSEVILCPPRPTGTLVYSAIALLFPLLDRNTSSSRETVVEPRLIVETELVEYAERLEPLDELVELVLHAVADVDDGGELLVADLVVSQLLLRHVAELAVAGARVGVEQGLHGHSCWGGGCELKEQKCSGFLM